MTVPRILLFAAALGFGTLPVFAQSEATPATGFSLLASYDRPGLPVPHWQLRVAPSGQAEYTSEHAPGGSSTGTGSINFQLSQSGAAKLRQLLDDSHGMQPCETKTKGLARMGMKTLEYRSAPQGPTAQCTFNYTENKPLSSAAEYLLAVSFTIEQGSLLDHLHRYDRLGLDPAMTQLATAYKAGQAKELQAIRPTLESLVNDDAVLERVRQKASELLVASNRP